MSQFGFSYYEATEERSFKNLFYLIASVPKYKPKKKEKDDEKKGGHIGTILGAIPRK